MDNPASNNIFLRNSQLAVLLYHIFNQQLRKTGKQSIVDHYKKLYNENSEGYKVAIKQLMKISESAKKDDINIYMVMIPDIHDLENYKLSFIHNLMKTKAEDMGYIFIDMYPILKGLKPNITFVLKVSPNTSRKGLKKRRTLNRYDNFAQSFYTKAQKSFLKIAKGKKNYFVLDSSYNDNILEKKIFAIITKHLKI